MLFCFTHDIEIDWMLPGIPPTGRYVEIPLVAIVRFRGDKLYNEHIYWDQASVLVQIGLLDPKGLPVAGSRDGEEAGRREPALQHPDGALGGERSAAERVAGIDRPRNDRPSTAGPVSIRMGVNRGISGTAI